MSLELEIKEHVEVPEGKHQGVITKVEERKYEKYSYIDISVSVDGKYDLRYGCPATVSKGSKLGKTLSNFIELKAGEKVDIEKVLVGRKVTLMTMLDAPTEDGIVYSRIVDGSIKPLVEEKAEKHEHSYKPQTDGSLKCGCGDTVVIK